MIEGFSKVYDGDVSGTCGGFNRIWQLFRWGSKGDSNVIQNIFNWLTGKTVVLLKEMDNTEE